MDLLKKEVDPETKGKQQDSRKDNLPARVGKLTGNPANVETKAGRVASDSANVQDASRKGGLLLVFHRFNME